GAPVEAACPEGGAPRSTAGRGRPTVSVGVTADLGGGAVAAGVHDRRGCQSAQAVGHGGIPLVTSVGRAHPPIFFMGAATPNPRKIIGLPLFWRLLGVNLVVVLGGALIGTWLTQRLVLSGTFTPWTHALLVLAALCLSAGLTMLLLRETFRPIRSLRDATRRFNAGDHSARATLAPYTDPDVAALVVDVNALWDQLEA